MSHRTNGLASIADFINREGFEWLMHPFNNYHYSLAKYPHHPLRGGIYYGLRMLITLALTAIPVIPALYVLNRLAVIADVKTNPLKTVGMMTVFGTFAAVIAGVGFNPIVREMASWVGKSFAYMPGWVPAPFIVGGVFIIVGALALYGVKLAVQTWNNYRYQGATSTPKHLYPARNGVTQPHLLSLYQETRQKHTNMKMLMRNHPDQFMFHGDGELNDKKSTNSIGSAQETIEMGKCTLDGLESLIKAHHHGEEVQKEFDYLFMGRGSPNETGMYWQWKNAAKLTTKALDFSIEENAQGSIAIDRSIRKLRDIT